MRQRDISLRINIDKNIILIKRINSMRKGMLMFNNCRNNKIKKNNSIVKMIVDLLIKSRVIYKYEEIINNKCIYDI